MKTHCSLGLSRLGRVVLFTAQVLALFAVSSLFTACDDDTTKVPDLSPPVDMAMSQNG